jgi:predicted nucleotidyltransferase component of viral defense system
VKDTIFYRQAELVLRILPDVLVEEIFALKGGTAINFFFRDLPRLSVDIDLTYLPLTHRGKALQDIHDALQRIADRLKRKQPGTKIMPRVSRETSRCGFIVTRDDATVKIEPNTIMRGTVYPVQIRPLARRAQELFEFHTEARSLSLADLYGGKICAALDRQHPRDLYDIHLLFRAEGITDEIRKPSSCLICQPRPILEFSTRRWLTSEDRSRGIPQHGPQAGDMRAPRKRKDTIVRRDQTGLTDEEKIFIVS